RDPVPVGRATAPAKGGPGGPAGRLKTGRHGGVVAASFQLAGSPRPVENRPPRAIIPPCTPPAATSCFCPGTGRAPAAALPRVGLVAGPNERLLRRGHGWRPGGQRQASARLRHLLQ